MTDSTLIQRQEIEAIAAENQQPGLAAIRLILSELQREGRDRLAFQLGETLATISGAPDTRLPPLSPNAYHHLVGNLAAIRLEAALQDDQLDVAGTIKALAASTHGKQAALWENIHRLITTTNDHDPDSDGREGQIATLERSRDKRRGRGRAFKRSVRRIDTLMEMTTATYPSGIDLLGTPPFGDAIKTLDAGQPITIEFGESGEENVMRIAPNARGNETRITWVQHDVEYFEPRQSVLYEDDFALVAEDRDVGGCFGTKLTNIVSLPTDIDLGKNPIASHFIIARLRGRIALLLRRPRGILRITQGNEFWRFDPTAVHEDTYGLTDHVVMDEDHDDEDEQDTVLE